MTSIRTSHAFAPVPNSFVEVAPATLIGLFEYNFGVAPQPSIYIRPGQLNQQDYLDSDGSEWLLYTRSVMSFRVGVGGNNLPIGGASLIVETGDVELAGVPQMRQWVPFHFGSGSGFQTSLSNIEMPGLLARFVIQTASDTPSSGVLVTGSIIVRGM